VQHQNQFPDNNIPKSYLTQIRGFSRYKNEIKRIRKVITVVITSKTQIKEKELKVKQWVISQEYFSLMPLS
jgi:hypothetical protein